MAWRGVEMRMIGNEDIHTSADRAVLRHMRLNVEFAFKPAVW
jgi:hypothetical protein